MKLQYIENRTTEMILWLFLLFLTGDRVVVNARRQHHNNNRLMELLTAGIVAKVLQKQEDDGGGHHDYYPVPIHIPVHHHGHGSGSARYPVATSSSAHHHVTEKIIPIPIPQHTTRIIHINADNLQGTPLSGGDTYDQGSGGSSGGGSSHYDNDDPHDDHPHHHYNSGASNKVKIKHIFFQDNPVYPPPVQQQEQYPRHPGYATAYRRPPMGMVPAGAHAAYMVKPRYPYGSMRHRVPHMSLPYGPPSMYRMPYGRAATYLNPMVVRRPYYPPPVMPMW